MSFTRGPYNSSHALYIGTTNGKIYRIDNPRQITPSFQPADITPPGLVGNVQDISVNPNNDEEVIAVVSNYGVTTGFGLQNIVNIWWTNNAKNPVPTWRQAEGNLGGGTNSGYISGRSCMIVVKKDGSGNPVTEYYVGTGAGLFSTQNLGQTLLAGSSPVWVREGAGVLNFAVISSLAYRPSDNVMVIGTHGNGMYFTYLGTPNFIPNTSTAILPITNDFNFILDVYPTVSNSLVYYKTGTQVGITKIDVQLTDMNGRLVFRKQEGYTNGRVDLTGLAKGNYILSIYSSNGRYRHIQKLVKQ
jgi:hypothetical protein